MRRAITRTIDVALIALLASAACDPEDRPPNLRVEKQLQQVLDRAVANPGVMIPGAIAHYRSAIYRPWSGAAGLGEIPAQVAMRPGDRFRAGSIPKTFLAAVTLQHVEAGTLALEQTLPTLLPEDVTSRIANADRITLKMLLNHSSGIPDWVSEEVHRQVAADPAKIWTVQEAIDLASRQPPLFPPGGGWSYSNTNYTLVGLVLERAGGKSWRAQVRERILDRLALRNTSLPEPGDRSMTGEFAHGYNVLDGETLDLSEVDPSMAGAPGGHAMITTAQDLGRFLEALLAGELFTQASTLAAMTTMIDAPHESKLPHRYGLGLEEFIIDGTTVIGHHGGTAGYATMMYRIPARDATLVTSLNRNDMFVNAVEVFMPALKVISSDGR
jgi:D-alanyl-D-alanine carboxypeptidase